MTVQFILPEAISFPKERKLHDRLFLVLLYNLLCKTFKDHSSTFAASSRIRAHPSFARALLPDCECKGRAFLLSLQDFHEKKCEKNSFALILPLYSIAKSVIKPDFSLHPLPVISSPKPPFFARFGHFWGKIHLFRGFFSSAREKFSPEISFCAEKISLMGRFSDQSTRNSTFADVEKRKEGGFSLPPPLHSKIQADFLSKLLHFSRLPPMFLLKPPRRSQNPFHSTRRTRAYAYIHARALSEFAVFSFTLHLTPQ